MTYGRDLTDREVRILQLVVRRAREGRTMNYVLWLGLVTRLASVVATQTGAAPRELAYLSLLTNAATLVALTNSDLEVLREKYEREVAEGTETTVAELDEIEKRIVERSKRIQGG